MRMGFRYRSANLPRCGQLGGSGHTPRRGRTPAGAMVLATPQPTGSDRSASPQFPRGAVLPGTGPLMRRVLRIGLSLASQRDPYFQTGNFPDGTHQYFYPIFNWDPLAGPTWQS